MSISARLWHAFGLEKEEKSAKFIIITFAHCSTKCLFYASSYADLLPSQCYFLQGRSLRRLSIICLFAVLFVSAILRDVIKQLCKDAKGKADQISFT